MSEWIEWNGGEMPVPKGTMVQLCYRSGDQAICSAGMSSLDPEFKRISGAPCLASRWAHYGDQSDIVKYMIYKPKGHPNASILMEIAKEAAINPEYWREFQYLYDLFDWEPVKAEYDLFRLIKCDEYQVRRKPSTIRIGNYDVPEPIEIFTSDGSLCVRFGSHLDACAMQKALQELLGEKK